MTRLAMAVLLGQSGHLAQAAQSQIPMRVGDCVKATTDLEFFYKDEGEYEQTHLIKQDTHGVLLNIDSDWNEPSDVEFFNQKTREPVVSGAVFFHQFARVPWKQGQIQQKGAASDPKCFTVKDANDGYAPVIQMAACAAPGSDDNKRWKQQFSYNYHECGTRPIRSTDDPSKCVDAVHPDKILLTTCSGVDSQKFLFRCSGDGASQECHILAMGGRKDMCLWYDESATGEADLRLRSCNFANAGTKQFLQKEVEDFHKHEQRV